jgi:esterase/lipase
LEKAAGGAIVSEAIITALITGGMSLTGVVATCLATARKSEKAMAVSQAVTDTKIEELTREVRLHNGFAEKIPVIQEQIKVINHRMEDLEQYHK